MRLNTLRLLSFVLLTSLLLSGCDRAVSTPSPTSTFVEAVPTPTPFPTPSPEATPTASPTPQPPLVLLLAPAGADPALLAALEPLLAELSSASGLRFETRPALALTDLTPGLQVVVGLAPDPGLAGLAAAEPETQFLGVAIPDLEATDNLSLVAPRGVRSAEVGFLAGYLAAVVAPEWRVGILSVNDTAAGLAARQGFLNGAVFFCGLCQQTYPPYGDYPLFVELPSAASLADWQAAASVLKDEAVEVVFVAPGAGDESLLAYLAESGINLIGAVSPPPSLQDHWIATIQPGFAQVVRDLWPDLLAGRGGQSLPVSPELADVNQALFSPGRQRLVEALLADLVGGFIDTGVAP